MKNIEGTTVPSSPPPEQPPRPRQSRRWPLIIVAMLVVHVLLMATATVIATHDRSFAVMPNYYEKALKWDQSQADKRASEQLGWKLTMEPSETIDPIGRRTVTFVLVNIDNKPIADATVELSYFHHSHATDVATAKFTTDAQGKATATLPMRFSGFWDINCVATTKTAKFTTTLTQFVNTAAPLARRTP